MCWTVLLCGLENLFYLDVIRMKYTALGWCLFIIGSKSSSLRVGQVKREDIERERREGQEKGGQRETDHNVAKERIINNQK